MIRKIDVAEKFRSQDYPRILQDPDYTDHRGGAEDTIVKFQGVISQTGLHKRKEEIKARAYDLKNKRWVGENTPSVKPIQKGGFLSLVDRFFLAVNRMIGD